MQKYARQTQVTFLLYYILFTLGGLRKLGNTLLKIDPGEAKLFQETTFFIIIFTRPDLYLPEVVNTVFPRIVSAETILF